MVAAVKTNLKAEKLLVELKKIEKILKRSKNIRWGPRTIDIDILLYNSLKINLPWLKIPHPRMYERAFVLVPLKDIWNGDLRKLEKLIEKCEDKGTTKKYSIFQEY